MNFYDPSAPHSKWNVPWTPTIDDALRRKRTTEGKHFVQISRELLAEFGIKVWPRSVGERAVKLCLPDRVTQWTEGKVAALRTKLSAGKSANYIMREINAEFPSDKPLTRNAIIGKAHRLGLPKRVSSKTFMGKTVHGGPRDQTRANRVKRALGHLNQGNEPTMPKRSALPVPRIIDLEIPLAQRKQLMDLGAHDCRWPVNDVGKPDFFFCGAATGGEHPYCPHHHERSVTVAPRHNRPSANWQPIRYF